MALHTLSLFAGCGGLDLAVGLAVPDSRVVCYVEREGTAAAILAARFADGSLDPAPIWSDVRTFDGRRWRGAVDLIVGGFPCTDLSVAGKRSGINGEHSGLWWEYARIIREVQPRWVFIENVPAVIAVEAGRAVLGKLYTLGFDAEWGTLRASDVGAPHQRKRVFILAWMADAARDVRSGLHGQDRARRRVCCAGGEVALPSLGGLGVRGEPSGGGGLADGGDEGMADPIGRFVPVAGRGPHGRDGAGSAGEVGLADSKIKRFGGGITSENQQSREEIPTSRAGGISIFPPGPADADAWRGTLARYPWLAPATQPGVCGLADGVAYVVDQSRADQLRATGNGVVAIQGAAALTILAQRAGIDWGGADE